MLSNDDFVQVANLLPVGMLLVRGDGLVLAANRTLAARLGVLAPELRGRPLADLLEGPTASLPEYLHRCGRSREPVLGALSFRLPGGERLACRCEGAVLEPRAGDRPARLLLRLVPRDTAGSRFIALTQRLDELAREIVRRKRVEEALRQQQQLLQVTLASIGDAVIATDTAGHVTFMNPVAEVLTAWEARDALRRPLPDVFTIINEQTRQPAEDPVAQALRDGRVVGLANHTVLVGRDGRERPIDDCAAPIRETGGDILGTVLVFHDVSERRRLERELRERADRLAEADRHKDELLLMLAHELRAPLAPLLNAAQVLRLAGAATPQGREHDQQARAIIDRQVRHLGRLVEAFLEVAELTSGSPHLSRERLDLGQVVRSTAEERRGAVEQAGLRLTVEVPAGVVCVLGDAARLGRALAQLLDNAVKFAAPPPPPGEVAVRVLVDGGQACLSVRDAGMGIAPELLPRLFEVFTQADRTLERTRGGLGLGLALVRAVVRLHGGDVAAASGGPGRGAEFTIRLPLAGAAAAEAAGAHAAPPVRRVLIVEDNQDTAESLRMLLEVHGHEVAVATTGPAGVRAALDWRPDVVLCDIGLPGLDGYGVARELRRNPATAGLLLVAVTGYGREEDRLRSREAGFDHHLTKPVDPAELQPLLVGLPRR